MPTRAQISANRAARLLFTIRSHQFSYPVWGMVWGKRKRAHDDLS
nr:MAG TPA: hypothetical protein [Caudoviricetes sp.]